ncbi:CHLG [Symbiodinium natans]|uniref:CHLG protein n=1 Tax=Symbiodinium natans TaxID=878477 RepID=A0A812Q162_9DINO|nr:CHLG [Symbiodinium natans]
MKGASETEDEPLWKIRLQLCKPVTWPPLIFGVIAGVCASGNFDWSTASPEEYAKFLLCVTLSGPVLVGYTQTLNDWYDKDLDAINEPYRPIPSGRITEEEVWQQIYVLGGLGLGMAITLDIWQGHWPPTVFAVAVVGVFMAYIYSAPPLKLKQNWISGCYALGSSYIALPWLAGQCTFGEADYVTPEIIGLTLWYSIAAVGIAIVNDFKSVEGDTKLGLSSAPVVFGVDTAKYMAPIIKDSVQLTIVGYLFYIGETNYALGLLALIVPQVYFAITLFLEDPIKNDVKYQGSSLPFFSIGTIVAASAIGARKCGGGKSMSLMALVATGRGLPTERRPFVGVVTDTGHLQPGGLYLDYARITYYDGAALLILMVLVVVAGGMDNTGPQLYGIMVSLCLVTVSWLLAPFIFNPYQFRPSCWANDMKAWLQFFLEDGGSHWKKWFTQTQLKPRRGFRATVLDLAFFIELWWVVACFSSLNARTAVVCQVSTTWRLYYWFLLLPPVITPLLFCVLVSGFGAVANCWMSRASKSSDSSSEETYEALSTSQAETASSCPRRCPLILVSVIVTALTVLETVPPLQWVASLGWKKACMLAFLLKMFWLRLCVGLAMTAIRSWCFERLGAVGRPLELWLDALCMFRDFLVSLIIFLALSPLVFLSGLSEFLCPTFSIHHLIIYRQPGHTDREKLDYDPFVARMCFDHDHDESSEDEDTESSLSSV